MIFSRMPVSTRSVTCDPLDDDEPHRCRERQPLTGDEAESDDRVEPEARRDRVGLVRVEAHQDRHHAGHEARCGEHLVEGEPDLGQALDSRKAEDLRVDEDDVRHDDERRHAGRRVPAERRPVLGEAEVPLQEAAAAAEAGRSV
jgi:hypothetical protein